MSARARSGVVLQGVDSPARFIEMVEEAERLDFDHLWLTDSSLHARNCYAYLTLAAMRTRRMLLGTAVTNPVTRHPGITAAAIATVDEISSGRAILGIGAGDRPLHALGLSPSSVATLEASIHAIRQLWRGEQVTLETPVFRLEHSHLRFESRAGVPVYVSASGPKTLEMAGRVADGVILLVGLFTEAVRWALGHIDRGAHDAGRPRPHVAVFAYGAIDEDASRALEAARSIAAWFPQTAPVICELAGLPDSTVASVRARYGGGEFQEAEAAAALLPASFVRQVALAGNREQAISRIREVLAAGADSMHVFPLGPNRLETIRAFASCWRQVASELAREATSGAPTTG